MISTVASAKNIIYPGPLEIAEIVRIYDADTVYVRLPDSSGLPIFTQNIGIRINGIDTPELRTRCKAEKVLGYKAKYAFVEILSKAKKIEIKNYFRGKYFRIVADVFVDGVNVKDLLIKTGLAKPYDGGTKTPWCPK